MENNKDKRISWLSIFSSLTQTISVADLKREGLANTAKLAYELNEGLYKEYPLEENAVKTEETEEKCPQCGSMKVIKQGVKNRNKWKGIFCSNPECEEKPRWLNPENPEEGAYNGKFVETNNG